MNPMHPLTYPMMHTYTHAPHACTGVGLTTSMTAEIDNADRCSSCSCAWPHVRVRSVFAHVCMGVCTCVCVRLCVCVMHMLVYAI